MKKHDEMRQVTTESVNSRNCIKERKAKPKEMMNTIGNAGRNKTKPTAKNV